MVTKIFSVQPRGGFANQMIQHMVALSVADRVPGCLIDGVSLPEWQIDQVALPKEELFHDHREAQRVDPGSLAALLNRGGVNQINYFGYGQRFENFLPRQRYHEVFADPYQGKLGFGSRQLVINIRGGEVLDGRHPGYVLIPSSFYQQVIDETGLEPVFIGQIEDNIYCDDLRRRFPGARFEESRGPMMDFATIRNSVNIIPAVSTFSWLASWLSNAERIFLPLSGLFNPFQYRDCDFVPAADARYHFTLFPANYAVPVAAYRATHDAIGTRWKPISASELSALQQRSTATTRNKDQHVALFDETYYLSCYTDIRKVVPKPLPSGLLHYIKFGFAEYRKPFNIDLAFYASTYPDAADAIGFGDFADAYHHYVERGASQNYARY